MVPCIFHNVPVSYSSSLDADNLPVWEGGTLRWVTNAVEPIGDDLPKGMKIFQ